eukprot:927677-Pelagomonas_calceolata.AAC.3
MAFPERDSLRAREGAWKMEEIQSSFLQKSICRSCRKAAFHPNPHATASFINPHCHVPLNKAARCTKPYPGNCKTGTT